MHAIVMIYRVIRFRFPLTQAETNHYPGQGVAGWKV
jgi:hypothetical protein